MFVGMLNGKKRNTKLYIIQRELHCVCEGNTVRKTRCRNSQNFVGVVLFQIFVMCLYFFHAGEK